MMKMILNELSDAIFSYLSKFLSRYMLDRREKKYWLIGQFLFIKPILSIKTNLKIIKIQLLEY